MTSSSISDESAPMVHVVDDDDLAREATGRFLEAAGYDVRTYRTATDFLRASPGSGCVVLDLQLPGESGLDLQRALLQSDEPLPIVFLTGCGEVPDSVQAMKAGAIDFLNKSADGSVLLEAVSRASAYGARQHAERARQRELRARYARLSPRERDVFAHLISGQLNKQVSFDLGIALQTTKIHRHRVLEKMEADSIAHLVRMAAVLAIDPVGTVR
jgi:FixJ family two-component response regulator